MRPGPRPTWRAATDGRWKGQRRRVGVPNEHWKTTTLVAGLRTAGIVAPMVLNGPIDGVVFQAYFEQILAPELRLGDIVVMDDLGSHKSAAVRHAIEAAGAQLLYLPALDPLVQFVVKIALQLPSQPDFDSRYQLALLELSTASLSLSAIRAKSGSDEAFIFRIT
jgi:hypothetical protein